MESMCDGVGAARCWKWLFFQNVIQVQPHARCVYHKGKTFVVYHKVTDVFHCGIFYHKHFLQFQGPLWYFVI